MGTQSQAIAQNGPAFTQDLFDSERYRHARRAAAAPELDVPLARAAVFWEGEHGYATPKVDVRGAVFSGDRVLLVRERSDGRWTLPGGWVDVNDAPSAAVTREIFEESGYRARPVKLAALVDKNRHPHPPSIHHIYKLLFLCELTGGAPAVSEETDAVEFFALAALPELSTGRILRSQIEAPLRSPPGTRPPHRLRLEAGGSCPSPTERHCAACGCALRRRCVRTPTRSSAHHPARPDAAIAATPGSQHTPSAHRCDGSSTRRSPSCASVWPTRRSTTIPGAQSRGFAGQISALPTRNSGPSSARSAPPVRYRRRRADVEFVATELDPLANIHSAGHAQLCQPWLADAAVRGYLSGTCASAHPGATSTEASRTSRPVRTALHARGEREVERRGPRPGLLQISRLSSAISSAATSSCR